MTTLTDERVLDLAGTKTKNFYVYMALSCVVIAFLGFVPTYWLPIMTGTFKARPIVHIHGLVFFS